MFKMNRIPCHSCAFIQTLELCCILVILFVLSDVTPPNLDGMEANPMV